MKSTLLILALVVCSCTWAQKSQISIYGSYVFDDSFDSYYDPNEYYEGKIEGGLQWGVGYEYFVRPQIGIELLYLRQDTKAPIRFSDGIFTGVRRVDFDLGLNYLLLGGTHHFRKAESPLEGFVGLSAGMMFGNLSNPENRNDENFTKFAWGVKLGGVYWTSDKIGIKLQAQMLSAVQAAGGGVYFGPYGASTGLSTYSTIYQFSLGGGLVYNIN